MNAAEKVIKVEDVFFSYGFGNVLHDISFSVPRGSVTSIIGPNGSGKTTLLKLCLGLLRPTEGFVHVLDATPGQVRKRIGYVPQRFNFDETFPIKVGEFLSFSAPEVAKDKIRAYLAHLGMERSVGVQLGRLSGGQLQRVMIARAMLRDPDILYLDEPSTGIDVGAEENFYEFVFHLRKQHESTIVLVSHEVDIVYKFSDQVVCVNKEMICHGTPEIALTPEVMERLYGKDVSAYRHAEKGNNENTHAHNKQHS